MPIERFQNVRKDINLIEGAVLRINGVPAIGSSVGGGGIQIGNNARIIPLSNGFKFQVRADGVTWQDGPTYTAN